LIAAFSSVIGSVLTFVAGIRQVRRSVSTAAEELGAPRAIELVEIQFLEAPDPSRIATDEPDPVLWTRS